MQETLNFGQALEIMQAGGKVARLGWWDVGIYITIQRPDEHSKMTKPYIYMYKRGDMFPCDMSCESILASDWVVIEDGSAS